VDSVAKGDGFDVAATDGATSDGGAKLRATALDGSADMDVDGEVAALAHPTRRTIDRSESAMPLDT